jgi:hypothetical protein
MLFINTEKGGNFQCILHHYTIKKVKSILWTIIHTEKIGPRELEDVNL